MRTEALILAAALCGCASSTAPDPGLEGLSIDKVAPGTIVPGTKIVVKGASFVDEQWGAATLHLVGKAGGKSVDLAWPAKFVDFNTLTVAVDDAKIDGLGGDVDFFGTISVDIVAASDGKTYSTDVLTRDLNFRKQLTPSVTGVVDGVAFVNDEIEVDGFGFLLGGDEGQTVAQVSGCFKLETSSSCVPIATQEIAMQPREELSREHASFPFSPKIAGIKPGTFTGKVTIFNKHANGASVMADAIDVDYDLVTAQVFSADPPKASLGQYVFVHGGGFVGGDPGALTELELTGTFNKTGMSPAPITMNLIPEFVEGRLVRYVLNTDDELGTSLDLRTETGKFTGRITPIIHYGGDTVRGVSSQAAFDIAPVKQVVWLEYQPSYVEGLRDFGLRAVDHKIRERILVELARIYQGVNIEFRAEVPTDFALYEHVALVGVDPNNQGLFGYDNSPGKDNGNVRLYDQLGGVNAKTQQDGYAGFGGVFLRSLMGFSKHPGSFAKSVPGADPVFDQLFDPFRADRDGTPVTSADLAGNLPLLTDGNACPGSDRETQIQCAIFVLGNLVGGTLGHEIGHSLGLANPYQEGFHNIGDAPARLKDSGGDRSFMERAELMGQTPAVFCDEEYDYLRQILPSSEAPNTVERPTCF
ncbi:MAG: hypothetical protein HOV81_10585 [Kofleriaceae bacterium]|nr:hypothetical protein [Kofleriaceae bacterium]